jgi:pantetheine-phosphate adenylyltransferase
MEGLIISRETVAGGDTIQRYREEHGFPPLELVVVDLIGASSQTADAQKLRSVSLFRAHHRTVGLGLHACED